MMKKLSLILSIAVASVFSTAPVKAQVHEQGGILIDAFYGWPNLYTAVIKSAYDSDPSFSTYGIKITSLGPIGGHFEYLISERIGIGLHGSYASSGIKGTTDAGYTYSAAISRFRIMPMVGIHIGSSDKVDPYVAFGGGYFSWKYKEKTDDPSYQEGTVSLSSPTPVAVRAEFGVRYFFTDNIGIHGRFGLGGGPLLGAGLSAKF